MHPDLAPALDITRAADGYSNLAGILAGFSFAILIWVVERLNLRDENIKEDVLIVRAMVLLGITFAGNLLLAFLWARVMGETQAFSARTQCLRYVAAWQFALLAPVTMTSITLVVATTGSSYAVTLFRRISSTLGLISQIFLWVNTVGIQAINRHAPLLQATQVIDLLFFAVSIGLTFGGYLVSRCAPGHRFYLDTESSFSNYISVLLFGIVLTGLFFGIVSVSAPGFSIPDLALLIANTVWSILVGWTAVFLPRDATMQLAPPPGPPHSPPSESL